MGLEIEVEKMAKLKKIEFLDRFPELWALKQNWNLHERVSIERTSNIHFLEKGIVPSSDMQTIKVFIVYTNPPNVRDVTLTRCRNQIVKTGKHEIDNPDGIGLRELVVSELVFRGKDIRCIFLLEEDGPPPGGDPGNQRWRITVVLPPQGQENFHKYGKEINLFLKKAAA